MVTPNDRCSHKDNNVNSIQLSLKNPEKLNCTKISSAVYGNQKPANKDFDARGYGKSGRQILKRCYSVVSN